MWSRIRDERGDSTVTFASLFPLFLAMMLFLVQVGMYYQAAMVAQSAADAGLHAARVADANPGQGHAAAEQVIGQHGNALQGASVQVSNLGGRIQVTVTGQSPTLIGQWSVPDVEKTVMGPVERVVR